MFDVSLQRQSRKTWLKQRERGARAALAFGNRIAQNERSALIKATDASALPTSLNLVGAQKRKAGMPNK